MRSGLLATALCVSSLGAGCQKGGVDIDWSQKENFFVIEKTDKNEDGSIRLEFHSIVDAPADAVFNLLAAPEDWVVFVEGVSDSGKISTSGNSKVTHITQSVIGRQNRAEVKWTAFPDKKHLEFETVKSDFTLNDGYYDVVPSPDGKRCYVISVFNVREKAGTKVPPGVLSSGTREGFAAAARSVKARALGQNLKQPS
jgi:hypothetical protein